MARNYAFRVFGLLVMMCFLGATISAPGSTRQDHSIDFNALLDGSLGYMPAQWMVSQGLLAEMDAANSTATTIPQGTSTPASTISPSSEPSNDRRDGKENGVALGALIGGLLVPQAFNIIDDGPAAGICKSLIDGAGAMAGLVVGQEAGKSLYPGADENNTTSSTDSETFESGVIPGAFLGSIVGNGVGSALSRTLCGKLVPGLERIWRAANPDAVMKMAKVLDRGLQEVLTAHLKEMGVDAAKATQFASQLQETIRLVDQVGVQDAFEHLNRQLLEGTADLTKAVAKDLKGLSKPALENLAKLGMKSTAMIGMPGAAELPFSPPTEPVGLLQKFTDSYKKTMEFAKQIPKAKKAVESIDQAVKGLDDTATKANDLIRAGLKDLVKAPLNDAANAAKGALKGLPKLGLWSFSGPDSDHGSKDKATETVTVRHTEHITAKHTQTVTSTKVAKQKVTQTITPTSHVTRTYTSTVEQPATTTASVTDTSTKIETRRTTATEHQTVQHHETITHTVTFTTISAVPVRGDRLMTIEGTRVP